MIFKNAYYIKLGEKGKWAENSITTSIIRIGWKETPLSDINNGNWNDIKKQIKEDFNKRNKKNGATQDYEALRRFCEATQEDIFITFHNGYMYWSTLYDTPVEEDNISKFRKTKNGWSCSPINNPDKIFNSNEISGRISKTQAFQGTLCKYTEEEIKIISRIINDIPNLKVDEIRTKKKEICGLITDLIKDLHWKDCEILADLIFQQSGWKRISMSGGNMEFMDMEYIDSITNEKYIVQVKSGANLSMFKNYEEKTKERKFKKLFFIAFHPDKSLKFYANEREDIEILIEDKLSEMIFDLGLLNWVLKKSF